MSNEINDEYYEYLERAIEITSIENKYELTYFCFHLSFMSFLYNTFYVMKYFNHDKINRLISLNNKYNIERENIFDLSVVAEKTFINDFLKCLNIHNNSIADFKTFVDRRDNCAHASGYIQYKKDDVVRFIDETLSKTDVIESKMASHITNILSEKLIKYWKDDDLFKVTIGVNYLHLIICESMISLSVLSKLTLNINDVFSANISVDDSLYLSKKITSKSMNLYLIYLKCTMINSEGFDEFESILSDIKNTSFENQVEEIIEELLSFNEIFNNDKISELINEIQPHV